VLGSLPGTRSHQDQQYYAHPQNAFWPIIEQVFDIRGSYRDRCAQLVAHDIALRDVLASAALSFPEKLAAWRKMLSVNVKS
jgi:hypoxanthine-DNA glycosylase